MRHRTGDSFERSSARRALVAALAAGLIVVGCSADLPDRDREAAAIVDEPADTDLVLTSATVRIRTEGCPPTFGLGTATVIDDGLLLTAAHTVAGRETIDVLRPGASATAAAQLVWFDPETDVAVLAADTGDIVPVRLSNARAQAGDIGVMAAVDLAGNASRLDDVSVRRHVNIETTDVWRDRPVTRSGFELDAVVEGGDSGALVVVDGEGVGIIWSRSTTAPDRAWAVDVPTDLTDPAYRSTLTHPVDSGRCP